GQDVVLREFCFDFGNGGIRSVVVPTDCRFILAQLLSWKELDHFAAGFGGFFNGFENSEAIERVGLATDSKAALLVFLWDFHFATDVESSHAQRERGQAEGPDGFWY